MREDVEREWSGRLAAEEAKRKEADEWATELARALEKEKKVRTCDPHSKSVRTQADDDDRYLFARHDSSWKANVARSRPS